MMTETDTDIWIKNTIILNSNPILNLYQAVKTSQQNINNGIDFCYSYSSINGNGMKSYCGKTLDDFLYISMLMRGFGTFAQSLISSGNIVWNNALFSLELIDIEVLILLAQMDAVSCLYSATKYAQQYRAESKVYNYAGTGFGTFTGTPLPQISYGQNQLYSWALQCQ